jgi:pyridoxamine 5'-phosphate oxidase
MNRDLADLRVNYSMAGLLEEDMLSNPFDQFTKWFVQAKEAKILEPNAMILSTVGDDGLPDSRTVLLKDLTDRSLIFYTNYSSIKAQQIDGHLHCALLFLWLDLERQVRIKGRVAKIDKEQSFLYFKSRPRESQIGAWTSPQSSVISSRDEIEQLFKDNLRRFENVEEIPLPEFWGGYEVIPTEIEFWQGRPNRLHDRIKYNKDKESWTMSRLAP